MDVLNSFEWDTYYEVSDKTLVKRQHKNRFSNVTTWTYTSDPVDISDETIQMRIQTPLMANARIKSVSNAMITVIGGTVTADLNVTLNYTNNNNSGYVIATITSSGTQTIKFSFTYTVYAYMAQVDLKSEGINPPLYKVNEVDFPDQSGTTWSLLYKNKNDPDPNNLVNPVDCFLYPARDLTIQIPSSGAKLDTNNTIDSGWMIFSDQHNTPIPSFMVNNESLSPSYTAGSVNGTYTATAIAFKKIGTQISVQFCSYGTRMVTQPQPPYYHGEDFCTWVDKGSYSSILVNTSAQSLRYNKQTSLPSTKTAMNNIRPASQATSTVTLGTGVLSENIHSKDSIDRTDAKNIKLITLPYCPTLITVSSANVVLGNEWWYTNNTLQLRDLNTKFKNTIETSYPHQIADLVWSTYQETLDGTGDRINKDPKLYHSDFYYKKFVYDSFSKIFRTECLDWEESLRASKDTPRFAFEFVTSRNIVSKFLFIFPEYTTGKKGIEDYDNMLAVARNNEEVLYNSQYLNYLRTGYNYDLKTKERNTAAGAAGIGISLATLVGSMALTASGVGAGIGVAGIVGSVAGLAGSAISLAKTTAQAEENIQRKLQESQNQAVSVNAADDYDLLEAYSGNMAKMCTYQVSTAMRDALDDMFYYAGYVVNEQYKPDVNIRYWFDFLQADLVITYTENLSKEIIELIKKKFSEGVTFFHCHTFNGVRKWDLAQEKENWEKWIVLANGGAQ